jgi:hypothetical protein
MAAVYNRDKDIQAYARSEAQKLIACVNNNEPLHFAVPNFEDAPRKCPRAIFKYYMGTLMNNPASKIRNGNAGDRTTFARVFIYEISAEPFMGGVQPPPDVGDTIDDLLDHIKQQDVFDVMVTTEASPYEIEVPVGSTVLFRSEDRATAYLARVRVVMNYVLAVRQHLAENGGKNAFTLNEVLMDIHRIIRVRASDFASVMVDMSGQIVDDLVASAANDFDDAEGMFDINQYRPALDAFFAIFRVTRDIKTYRARVSQRDLTPGNLASPAPVGALNAMDLRHQLSSKRQDDHSGAQDGPAAKRANQQEVKAVDQVARTFISRLREQFPSTLRFTQDETTVDAVGYVQANLFRLARKKNGKRNYASRKGTGPKKGPKHDRDSGAGSKSTKH